MNRTVRPVSHDCTQTCAQRLGVRRLDAALQFRNQYRPASQTWPFRRTPFRERSVPYGPRQKGGVEPPHSKVPSARPTFISCRLRTRTLTVKRRRRQAALFSPVPYRPASQTRHFRRSPVPRTKSPVWISEKRPRRAALFLPVPWRAASQMRPFRRSSVPQTKSPVWISETRRRQAAALQGAFGTAKRRPALFARQSDLSQNAPEISQAAQRIERRLDARIDKPGITF